MTIWPFSDTAKRLKWFRIGGQRILVSLPTGWFLFFFLIPFLIVLKISVSEIRIGVPPYGSIATWIKPSTWVLTFNLDHYRYLLFDDLYVLSFLKTLSTASVSTIVCLCIGYPMAYAIARSAPRWRLILVMLVILPFWTSFTIRVYAWMNLLSPQGLINTWLMHGGLTQAPLPLLYNDTAVCLGIVYSYLPFMVLPLYAVLEKIDPSLSETAADLGCTPWRIFWSIILPLSRSGIMAGSLLVFISAIGEYVIPELLGGSDCLMIGKVLWIEFFSNRHWPIASAVAIMLLLFVVVPIMWVQQKTLKPHDAGHVLS